MLLLIAIFVLIGLLMWSQQRRKDTEPPLYPGALPLIGHAHLLLGNSTKLYKLTKDVAKHCTSVGGAITFKFGPRTTYILTDPEDSLTVANTCFEKDPFYDFAKPWLGDGLITSKASIWKGHRKLLNPAFSPLILNSFLDVFNKQARRFVARLSVEVGNDAYNHFPYIYHNALETICLTAIGVDFNDKDISEAKYKYAVEHFFILMIERFQKIWLHVDFIFKFSNLKKKQDEMMQVLYQVSKTVLEKRKAEYLKNTQAEAAKESSTTSETKMMPLVDLLLELSIKQGAFNDTEIRNHIDTTIVAGSDTVSLTMFYSLLLIGAYPHVQERIYNELLDVLGPDDRDVSKYDLSRLVYLEAVLKESLRLYNPFPAVIRELEKDVKLRNCTLSAGVTCFLLVGGINHHSSWGADVDEFRPERWLDSTTLPTCSGAFAAFGLGKRNCIGKTYSYMYMKTVLAHMLRHYVVHADHKQLQIKLDLLLKPASEYHISIEKRIKRIE